MKILITGDRNWTDVSIIARELEAFPSGTIIVHGAARGVDTIADIVARELGFEVRSYPANWKKYGRYAGPIRNREMYKNEDPDLVLAFHSNIDESRGTKDMLLVAKHGGTITKLITQ